MKINIVKRKMIKPCIPTPQSLKNFKISFLDEIAPSMNGSIVLFYPSKPQRFIEKLEESLAKILPQFYVLAGRYIKSDYSVDCSDEGAEFVEAEAVGDEPFDITTATEQLQELLPLSTYRVDEPTDPLLSVQITDLSGGGLAIGVSTSHRIADGSTAATLIAAWSSCAGAGAAAAAFSPDFDESPAFFPGRGRGNFYGELCSVEEKEEVECLRLFFDKEAIDNLRPREGKLGFSSKVVVVSAVIAKALIDLDRAKHGRPRDCFLDHPVNIRGRTAPPLGQHACGNLVLHSLSCCKADDNDIGMFEHLVDLMGGAIRESVFDCARMTSLGGDEVNDIIMRATRDSHPRMSSGEAYGVWFTDCTKFGFYEADFGWGRPVWASLGPVRRPDLVFLMETRDGNGIDASLYLHKKDMHLFEQDPQIRLFANASKLRYAKLSL